uniref:Putative tick serine proteinase n=1 Tax=Ixodes ricinus TaxID=34613 RepID=V5IBY7_IXORI
MIMKPLSCIFFFKLLLVTPGLELEPCGRPRIQPVLDEEDRIYGGREAVPGSWPWHAGIYTNALFPFYICSGVLVSEKHVVTARHCLLKKSPATIRVHLGAHMRDTEDAGEESYLVEEICAHPLYQSPNTVLISQSSNTFRFMSLCGAQFLVSNINSQRRMTSQCSPCEKESTSPSLYCQCVCLKTWRRLL